MADPVSPQLTFLGAASWTGLLHAVAAILAVILIVTLLRWERRLVPSGVGWTLLALRIGSLGVVLLILLQPTWAWIVDQKRFGRIAVAIDVSDSMLTTDIQASPREQRQWMAGIGWLERSAPPQGDPGSPPPAEPPADHPAGIDADTWKELTARLARLNRIEISRQILFDGKPSLWDQLDRFGSLDLYLFAGRSAAAAPEDVADNLNSSPADLQPTSTEIDRLLTTVGVGSTDSPLLGIVLFTDGRDQNAEATGALAKSLGQNGIPIFPVVIGSAERPKDLSVVAIDAPTSVYRGDHPLVKVALSTSGFQGDALDVTLDLVEPDPSFTPQTKTITTNDGMVAVEFQLDADELGARKFVVSLPELPGETRQDNNRREFILQVVDDRSRTLLVDAEPRWEFRYLEIALARDERVDADVVLFRQPYLGVLPQPFFPQTWPTRGPMPNTSPLADRDLLIVGDVGPADFPESRWEEIEEFVAEQGGTLVLVAGRGGMPLAHRSAEMRALLPITQPRSVTANPRIGAVPTGRGWTWSLTPEGEQQTFLQFATDADANRAIWSLLPGAGWAIAGDPKPAATVWVWGRDDQAGSSVPLVVHQHYGLGQVIWLATDSTWRWRFRSADQFHHRFWGQLARHAVEAKLSAGNEFVQFGPLKPRYNVGEPIEFQARWSTRFLQQGADRSAVAEIYQNDKKVGQVDLRPDDRRPSLSSGRLSELPPGDYVARLVAPQFELGPKPVESPLTITTPLTGEAAELAANPAYLQALADASGGKLFTADTAVDIPRHLPAYEALTSLPQERPLWDGWPSYVLLATLLTIEWAVRRRNGLP